MKAVSNEQIIAALLQSGTVKEAAAAVGIKPRTLYDRFNDNEFRAEYMEAKNGIIRKAVFTINEKLSAAIDTVCDIMTDKDNSALVRLQAAQTIINNAGKFADRLSQDEYQARTEGRPPFSIEF